MFSEIMMDDGVVTLLFSVVCKLSFCVPVSSAPLVTERVMFLLSVVLACAVPKSNVKYMKQTVLGLVMVLFGLLLVYSEVLLSAEF